MTPPSGAPLVEAPVPTAAAFETGLYVHIPFCDVKCRFCDFATFPGRRGDIPRYLAALAVELEGLARRFPGRLLATLYVGGGTPSLLSPEELGRLTASIEPFFPRGDRRESTLECNPESASPQKLQAFRLAGFNRLSLGLQTTDDALLKVLGRNHTHATFQTAFRAARRAGFSNINVDLMYGLPGQTLAGWRDTLTRVIDTGPEHLSAYALTVEEETYFNRSGVAVDGDLQADMYEAASDLLAVAGYGHYEISNFAKPGRECRHNLRYWRNRECLGAGVSAAWYAEGVRRTNVDTLTAYLLAVETGRSPVAEETSLTPAQRLGEDLMLGLRLREGVQVTPEVMALYGPVLERFTGNSLLKKTGSRITPTRDGWRLSNQIFQNLLEPEIHA